MTVLNAGRKYLNLRSLAGKVFLSSGLGGMSGAQAKVKMAYLKYIHRLESYFSQASVICGCVGVIAEVSLEALQKRHAQGWVVEVIEDLDLLIKRIRETKAIKKVRISHNHIALRVDFSLSKLGMFKCFTNILN